jgi:hypothetical protein
MTAFTDAFAARRGRLDETFHEPLWFSPMLSGDYTNDVADPDRTARELTGRIVSEDETQTGDGTRPGDKKIKMRIGGGDIFIKVPLDQFGSSADWPRRHDRLTATDREGDQVFQIVSRPKLRGTRLIMDVVTTT